MLLENKIIAINNWQNTIEVFDEIEHVGSYMMDNYDTILLNAELVTLPDASIRIKGDELQWHFLHLESPFLEDLDSSKFPAHNVKIYMGYRTLLDFFKGIKKQRIKSNRWYRLKETKKYVSIVNVWKIKIN